MYRVIIEFKDELSDDIKKKLKELAANCFDNRGGSLKDLCSDSNQCIFEGDDNKYGCIALANLTFNEVSNVKKMLKRWDWEDTEDIRFNHSVMQAYLEVEHGIF